MRYIYIPKKNKNIYPHTTCTLICTAALFIITKMWKPQLIEGLQVPNNLGMNKQNMVYLHNKVFLAIKRNEEVLIHDTTRVNIENIKLKKPITKVHILWLHLHEVCGRDKSTSTECRLAANAECREGGTRLTTKGCGVPSEVKPSWICIVVQNFVIIIRTTKLFT